MADCYCDNEIACAFYFRSMRPPTNYVRLKLSASCSRVLGRFDVFPDVNHKHWVDNMHVSINYAVQSLKCKAHAMVEGERIKCGRAFLDMHK